MNISDGKLLICHNYKEHIRNGIFMKVIIFLYRLELTHCFGKSSCTALCYECKSSKCNSGNCSNIQVQQPTEMHTLVLELVQSI